MKGAIDNQKRFRVPTTGKGDSYWEYPRVYRTSGGVVLHESVDTPALFTVSHETSGFALLSNTDRQTAENFFMNVSLWPEWVSIKNKGDAQFLRARIQQAKREAA